MIKIFVTAFFLFILSCTSPSEKKSIEIKNGDVSIAYTLSGNGDTAIVLVHGWCINKGVLAAAARST